MKDFIREYQHQNDIKNGKMLKSYYNAYKAEWKERMTEFLIEQLGISEENAYEAKKKPEKYFITYDTYKLFVNDK
jgi:aminoglycoside phosphotransferase family enzyme